MKTKLVLTCYCKCGKKFKNNILNSTGIVITYDDNYNPTLGYVYFCSKCDSWNTEKIG